MSARILIVDDSRTIRRVVRRTLERAGYEASDAADGREALERMQSAPFDLVLVDHFMQHMDGTHFCEAMRSIANLRSVPVVLMSAKAEQIGDEFVARTGAVDAISKPFGPEALLAVTAHALSKTTEDAGPAPRPIREQDEPGAADAARIDAVERTAAALAEALAPAVRGLLARRVEISDENLAAAFAEGLPQETLLDLGDRLRRALPWERGDESFAGSSDHVPLGELLQMLQHQRLSGVLEVTGGERSIRIFMREGMVDIVLGQGSQSEFLLGRYLLEEELVEREDLDMLLRRRGGNRRLIGAQLVKLGYIGADDLTRALVRQTCELVYEALRWPSSRYRFERFATRPEAQDARLGLPIASILMEGLRRVDEWRLVEEQIHDFDMSLARRQDAIDALNPEDLSREEHAVLGAIDGGRTVRQIVEHTAMGSFPVCKILFQLMTSGLVREVAPD